MLHGVETDQGACATETSLAVDGDCAGLGVGEVGLARRHELVHDCLGWCRTISEDHVFVVNVLVQERLTIVLGFVEANNFVDSEVLEDVDVAGSCVAISVDRVTSVDGAHKSQELAWDDPVKVAVLDLFVMLVLSSIECLEIVPSLLNAHLETLKTL